MKHRVFFLTIVAVVAVALTACRLKPASQQTLHEEPVSESPVSAAAPASGDPSAEQGQASNQDAAQPVPPCLSEAARPKAVARRKPRPMQEPEKLAPTEPRPARMVSSIPEVKAIEGSVGSILGKKVEGSAGEDLGRIVDVQADAMGRVHLVIIEFGGFLGVGNRRIAVDWGLLRFHPDEPDRPVALAVNSQQLQLMPEYRPASQPRALMAPTPPTAAPAAN